MQRGNKPAGGMDLSALALLCLYLGFWGSLFAAGRGILLIVIGASVQLLLFVYGVPRQARLYLLPVVCVALFACMLVFGGPGGGPLAPHEMDDARAWPASFDGWPADTGGPPDGAPDV